MNFLVHIIICNSIYNIPLNLTCGLLLIQQAICFPQTLEPFTTHRNDSVFEMSWIGKVKKLILFWFMHLLSSFKLCAEEA